MANILLIETATETCSVAMSEKGRVVSVRSVMGDHAANITVLSAQCVAEAGMSLRRLDAVAVSSGPGSYTGLRVGSSAAKGLCMALDIPLIAVDTLQAMAFGASLALPKVYRPPLFAPMLDARRQEVWTALYDAQNKPLCPAQPLIMENNLLEDFLGRFLGDPSSYWIIFSGSGSFKIKNVSLPRKTVSSHVPMSAAHMASLAFERFKIGVFEDYTYFEPFYMKPPQVTTPSARPF